MESQQIAPHHSHVHQSVEAGEDEDHEKKSVLKKVKAKAKKIKETITKHGHDHDHHGDHPQHYDLDEEDDDNDEDGGVLKDPNLQGAPWSQEAGASQIMDSFAKIKVNDKNQANRAGLSTGSHDQFSPDPNHPKMDENQAGDRHSSYAQKISAVGSAVAGTAISAKDFVASKLHYGGKTPGEGEDKGVSVKEYLAQKLEPGEDDRALSEAISEAFHKRNEEITKVTESEELTRRLGTEDNRETERSGTAARSVVDIVKDTVGSWMGKGGDHSPASHEQSEDNKKSEMRDDSKEAEVRIL